MYNMHRQHMLSCRMTDLGAKAPHPDSFPDAEKPEGLPACDLSPAPVSYPDAVTEMENHLKAMRNGQKGELLWFLEHPPLYTAGTSAREKDLLLPEKFPVHRSGRGGQFTYHGPGQRVVYVMLDLNKRGRDVKRFVRQLQDWIVRTLRECGLEARPDAGHVGVWVDRPDLGEGRADKIAAIGIRLRKWMSFHGISINVNPDLSHFDGIVPCGISDRNVTSMAEMGLDVTLSELDLALMKTFTKSFQTR